MPARPVVRSRFVFALVLLASGAVLVAPPPPAPAQETELTAASSPFIDVVRLAAEGQRTFRRDTFGDEVFWGDDRLEEAAAAAAR